MAARTSSTGVPGATSVVQVSCCLKPFPASRPTAVAQQQSHPLPDLPPSSPDDHALHEVTLAGSAGLHGHRLAALECEGHFKLTVCARTMMQLQDAAELRRAHTAPQMRAQPAKHRVGTPFARTASSTWCPAPDLEHSMCRVVPDR